MKFSHVVAVASLACGLVSARVAAQVRAPADGGRTISLGQPSPWHWAFGGAMGLARQDGGTLAVSELRFATTRDVGNSASGIAALQFEAFGGTRANDGDGGGRVRLLSPFFRLGAGAEYDVRERHSKVFLTYVHPLWRGGLFQDGSHLRLDVAPNRQTFEVRIGLEKPLQRRPPPGRSRPRLDHAPLSARAPVIAPVPDVAAVRVALDEARECAEWIGTYVVPYLDHPNGNLARSERAVRAQVATLGAGLTQVDPAGVARPRLMEDEVRRYHAAVARAFAAALQAGVPGADAERANAWAQRVAAEARRVLLDEVLLPYDRLLGQAKVEDTTNEYARRAIGVFTTWLQIESGVPAEGWPAASGVFGEVLAMFEAHRARAKAQWRDSREVWLPLQYALLPEEHDSQEELDALVERATRADFSEGNYLSYAINEQAQYQFARMVRAARDYHVLWVHDIRGVDDQGDPDEQSYRHMLGAYLRAMTERVRAYDSTGTFPTYVIIIDEWFYSWRYGRLWLDLLEDPLRHEVELPRGYGDWEDSLRVAQDSLRAAVARSRLLQARRAQFGDRWLRNVVKVHVNVTNRTDWSFLSRRLIPHFATPDASLRDHRKVAFYDLSEQDPYRGEAMYTGAGIGENYSNRTWEDRSLLVRGPAALPLKTAARLMLMKQGMDSTEIPWVLREQPRGAAVGERVPEGVELHRRSFRALTVHNGTGYGAKDVNVAKAVLYTLMPPGAVIKIPDSLWNESFWGAALAGCALRGGRVLIIAPRESGIPVPAFGSVQQAYELEWRLLLVGSALREEIAARGGLLRVGIFSSQLEVVDVPGKVEAVHATFTRHAWLRELYGFPPETYDQLAAMIVALEPLRAALQEMQATCPEPFEDEGVAKLHPKVNIFASREAWTMMGRREWMDMTWEFIQQRINQVQHRCQSVLSFPDSLPDLRLTVADGAIQAWYGALPDSVRARVAFFTLMGSHNQNGRSFVTDGEVALAVSGWPAIVPYLDMISLVGLSEWIERPEDLAALHAPKGWLKTRAAHWARHVF